MRFDCTPENVSTRQNQFSFRQRELEYQRPLNLEPTALYGQDLLQHGEFDHLRFRPSDVLVRDGRSSKLDRGRNITLRQWRPIDMATGLQGEPRKKRAFCPPNAVRDRKPTRTLTASNLDMTTPGLITSA
jgi:hypothetical protein